MKAIIHEIISHLEKHLGDVVEDPESPEAAEECWTLAIDKANELIGSGDEARSFAKTACKFVGYPRAK